MRDEPCKKKKRAISNLFLLQKGRKRKDDVGRMLSRRQYCTLTGGVPCFLNYKRNGSDDNNKWIKATCRYLTQERCVRVKSVFSVGRYLTFMEVSRVSDLLWSASFGSSSKLRRLRGGVSR